MQKLMGFMRSAMEHYNMIEPGDCVAVGLSGGKDSVALLVALAEMRAFYPQPYTLVALTVDPCFDGVPGDYAALRELCEGLGIPHVVRRTQLAQIIFEQRKEPNPCSLCARMRRGILHDESRANGCNKIALGHHLDDLAQTFLMNLLGNGTIGCFSPVTYLSRKDITMIRPMIYVRESDAARVVHKLDLPVVKSRCPVDGETHREQAKQLLKTLEPQYGEVRRKILGALERRELDGYCAQAAANATENRA